jgi:hypothetical protein
MIDTRTGTPLKPRASNFYYKSSTTTTPTNQLHALPVGLVMIAGDSKATGPLPNIPELYHIAHNYQCVAPSGPSIDPMTSQSIPNCPVGSQLWMNVGFPSCWDGVHLDSADHKSHMAYAWRGVCPADHPIMIPDISFHIIYDVTEANAPLHWRLVSDNYDSSLPGGYSGHGDWMGAWDTSISDTWLKLCDNASLDCHSGLLGDGREIY